MRVQRDMGWTMSELTKLETIIEHTIFRRLHEATNREKDRCRGRPEDDFTGLPSYDTSPLFLIYDYTSYKTEG